MLNFIGIASFTHDDTLWEIHHFLPFTEMRNPLNKEFIKVIYLVSFCPSLVNIMPLTFIQMWMNNKNIYI